MGPFVAAWFACLIVAKASRFSHHKTWIGAPYLFCHLIAWSVSSNKMIEITA